MVPRFRSRSVKAAGASQRVLGTAKAYGDTGASFLRARYAVSGTEIAYGGSAYGCATQCPVLKQRM
eukprot:3106400-Rhodomonas_salina.2